MMEVERTVILSSFDNDNYNKHMLNCYSVVDAGPLSVRTFSADFKKCSLLCTFEVTPIQLQ